MSQATTRAYVELVVERPVERFLHRFFASSLDFDQLVIVSPIIGTLRGTHRKLEDVVRKIDEEQIRTYVITCPPEEGSPHFEAINTLFQSDWIEIRYNPSLHAKVYVCRSQHRGFALLGSGNLTFTSIVKRIEVGVLVSSRGPGRDLVHELFHWAAVRLRTLSASKLVKPIAARRRR